VAAQADSGATSLREEDPAGSIKWRAGELGRGGVGRAAKGQLAAGENAGDGRRCRETERGKQEEEDEDLFVNFAKVQGVH
jgi:hypothetical protein